MLDLNGNCRDVEHCPDIAKGIKECQAKGIKVIVSWAELWAPTVARKWDPDLLAWWMWNKFLGGYERTLRRPFGDAVLDGVDLDPEGKKKITRRMRQRSPIDFKPRAVRGTPVLWIHCAVFSRRPIQYKILHHSRAAMPDLDSHDQNAVYNILHPSEEYDAYPDMVFVQFYNNYCSATSFGKGKGFNFHAWDQWATSHSKRQTKVYLGILGKEDHMDTGYVDYERLTLILDSIHNKQSFGGVMIWDAQYAYSNLVPYMNVQYGQAVVQYLDHFSKRNRALLADYEDVAKGVNRHIPVLIPVNKSYVGALPCPGQLFMLLHPVTCRTLAETFGVSADEVDADLDRMGLDPTAFLNTGSSICIGFRPDQQIVGLNYVYNATDDK